MRRSLVPALGLIAVTGGCNPQNAQVPEGSFTAALAYSTSNTLLLEAVDLEAFEKRVSFDCRDAPEEGEFDFRLPTRNGDLCDENACVKTDDPTDIQYVDSSEVEALTADGYDCDESYPPVHETWLAFDGFEVVTSPLEPWRGEAIITSEGDLQITIHNRLPGGADFRFAFVVDPKFQPRTCIADPETGGPKRVDIDGDWLANWSKDVDSGTLFYLNAGSYQFNPANLAESWTLPQEWLAGAAFARFAEEDFIARSVRYGRPSKYLAYEVDDSELTARDLFYCDVDAGADPTTDECIQGMKERVNGFAQDVRNELHLIDADVTPRVHTNEWRPPDGNEPGLDAWMEMNYNYVRVDQAPDELIVGNPASGDFELVFDGLDSQSRLFIKGKFEVEKIKKDNWGVQDLRAEKYEEYGTILCGEPAAPPAE